MSACCAGESRKVKLALRVFVVSVRPRSNCARAIGCDVPLTAAGCEASTDRIIRLRELTWPLPVPPTVSNSAVAHAYAQALFFMNRTLITSIYVQRRKAIAIDSGYRIEGCIPK